MAAGDWICKFCGTVWSARFKTCTCPGMTQHLRDNEEKYWR